MYATMRIILVCAAVVLQFGLGLRPLLTQGHASRGLAVAAFVVLAAVTAVCCGWVVRRKPLPVALVAVAAPVVVAASFCATAAVAPDQRFQTPDWSFGLVGWHLLVLLLDRAGVLVAVLAAHLVASTGLFLAAGVPERAAFGAAGAAAFGALAVQLAVVVVTRVLHRQSHEAAAEAEERDRSVTRMLAARQGDRDLHSLFAGRLGATLPLLAGLADGALDPRDAATQRRCALAATQLRRLFAENDDVPDPLVHEVAACVDAAERRGMDVSFAVSGVPVPVPPQVRRELTGPVITALSAARSRARVSVLRTAEEVRIAVVADARDEVVTVPTGRVAVECGVHGEYLRLEARWRTRQG
ncbi:hypothetical protein [Streptomyces sp. V2I9]|uniref:hypothetical protein n=1 Tax=Streptomyces sp. V2I9 TaxID=3042304 RepID=UPI00278421DF|nr:hypothetical protein [Streptomyces sp. V2I9]MDQ0983012.1 hypothetical protein [Streptomyces sp. V2I9]